MTAQDLARGLRQRLYADPYTDRWLVASHSDEKIIGLEVGCDICSQPLVGVEELKSIVENTGNVNHFVDQARGIVTARMAQHIKECRLCRP